MATFTVTVPDAAVPTLVKAAAAYLGIAEPPQAQWQQLGNDVCKSFLKNELYENRKAQDAGMTARALADAEVWP